MIEQKSFAKTLSLVIALGFYFLFTTAAQGEGCFSIIVGKDVSADGYVIMAHNEDDEFIRAIVGPRTYEKIPVRARFKIWFDSLRKITENQSNIFSLELKKQVYDRNPECRICGKRIQILDDAEIHNVDYYWRGETIPIDARVAHRYCNRK